MKKKIIFEAKMDKNFVSSTLALLLSNETLMSDLSSIIYQTIYMYC